MRKVSSYVHINLVLPYELRVEEYEELIGNMIKDLPDNITFDGAYWGIQQKWGNEEHN